MKKVIAIGLYVPGTGFTRVLQSLFEFLKDTHEIHWIGVGYRGPIIESNGYSIYPNNVTGGDAFGAYFGEKLARKLSADVILILNDFWMLKNYERSLSRLPEAIKKIAYVPLDGKIVAEEILIDCNFLDEIILFTNFALKQTKQAFSRLKKSKKISKSPSLRVIPHGVDLDAFRQVSPVIAKNLCFSTIPHAEQATFILNANRPVERKGLHLTIKGFAKALPSFKERTFLVLHHGGLETLEKEHCLDLINTLKIKDYVLIDPLGKNGYVKDEELNLLYNACDIGVNSSYGEGWGLISFEHAITGAPQIVPDHTSCSEIWKGAALLTPTQKDIQFSTNPFVMSEISVEKLCDQLVELVNEVEVRNTYSALGVRNCKQKKYRWKEIAKKWATLF